MKPWLLAAALTGLSLASAWADDRQDFINGLGDVLAAEIFCGLQYDQAALAALIEAHIESTDMAFTQGLKSAVWWSDSQQQKMGDTLKVAHCTQVGRVAVGLGLMGR